MSERTPARPLFALLLQALLLLAAVPPAHAQRETARDELADLRAQVAELEQRYRAADAAVNREYSLRKDSILRAATRERLDTARVGPFQVVARPALLPEAVRFLSVGWRTFEPIVGNGVKPDHGFVLLVLREPVPLYEAMHERPAHHLVRVPRSLEAERPEDVAVRQVSTLLGTLLPSDIHRWLGSRWLGNPLEEEEVYRQLALAPSDAAGRCFRHEARACGDALRLTAPSAPWSSWYAPEQLRRFALGRVVRGLPDADQEACRQEDAAACIRFLQRTGEPPPPLNALARCSFLRHVLKAGGPGAFQRLLADSTGTIEERLTRVLGGPLEPELAAWRAGLDRFRVAGIRSGRASRLAVVFWLLVFAGLAMRSTRWRLG